MNTTTYKHQEKNNIDWSKALCYLIPVTIITLASACFTIWTNGFWVDAVLQAPNTSYSGKLLFVCLILMWIGLWVEEKKTQI